MKSNLNYWQGKTALVTGGSSGIGLAAARLLAAHGASVWIIARNREKLNVSLQDIRSHALRSGRSCGMVSADLANAAEATAAVEQVIEEAGAPDLVINSAGAAHPGYVQELSLDIFRWMMETNYFATVYVVKAVLPIMLERRFGHIVNISSAAGLLGTFGYSAYGASKYAVNGFSEVLRMELHSYGIRVSLVFPPDTQTPQLEYENQFKPLETKALAGNIEAMSADSVARVILDKAARGKFMIFPNADTYSLYLLTKLLPKSMGFAIMDWMIARAKKRH